ncbi:UNVERIFIED_CONTAM: hypothetical protein K2H54_052844 [Gekko kuhli]
MTADFKTVPWDRAHSQGLWEEEPKHVRASFSPLRRSNFHDVSYLSPLICAVFIVMIPLWVAIAKQSPPIAEVLKSGWQPVIVAMTISSIGGLILNKTVAKPNFEGMAVFTPVINEYD